VSDKWIMYSGLKVIFKEDSLLFQLRTQVVKLDLIDKTYLRLNFGPDLIYYFQWWANLQL
jgi:hypothetical protein